MRTTRIRKSLLLAWLLGIAGFSISLPGSATILTFDGFGTPGLVNAIPDDYGDRVTALIDPIAGYEYLMGNGFTPNITLSYFPDPTATGIPFSAWPTGYGDLDNALGHNLFNVPGEVVLTADPGFQILLNSFDIAGWATGTYVDSQIRILNDLDEVLFDSGFLDINSSYSSHLTFPSNPILSAQVLRIVVDDYGDLGLDNVNFDQVSTAVPEPGTLALLGLGLAGMGITRRRKKI